MMFDLTEEEIDIATGAISQYFGSGIQYFPRAKALRNKLLEGKTMMERNAELTRRKHL
jgi:hypothetical protein